MFTKILIANRGAIATRIINTLNTLNIESVAIYHQSDMASLHVQNATQAYCLGSGTVAQTYLDIDKIINIAKKTGAEAIHPGYGFLSENTDFVARCEQEGLVFIGPTSNQINLFGLKHKARELASNADVPLVPGSSLLTDYTQASTYAEKIGYPVILKSTAGGGGIGMEVCENTDALKQAWDSVKRVSQNYFANDGVFIEKFIKHARHIEVQIFGNGKGEVISLGERDCSAQRRNQKVLEESPAPNLSDDLRLALHQTAERLMASVQYQNAGTVEFIFDVTDQTFYFLEVNTRLQVEHGITEEVWGIDLVELMVKQAATLELNLHEIKRALSPKGHAVELRLYAEDTQENFRPSTGVITQVHFPNDPYLRVDHWLENGIEISPLFDPMLAKVIATGETRSDALANLKSSLKNTRLYGIETNKAYAIALIESEECKKGSLFTRFLTDFKYISHTISVLDGGMQTTIQDFPARLGYWAIGVPPSGPMDNLHFRLANRILGNTPDCAALEITMNGPTLLFHTDKKVALCGAAISATVNNQQIEYDRPTLIRAGQTLTIGRVKKDGARAYLAIDGGIDCADYLGSKSTFTLGQFGGHAGRALRATDVLHLNQTKKHTVDNNIAKDFARPLITDQWTLRVIYGPHGAPDFFTPKDIKTFIESTWEVHFNSSRTGIRLIGPKPEWARTDGGEAGLHPSNIHDNAYAFGSIDFTGDMPVILGPDGPSLGGFVCPFTVIQADLWKLGQLSAGAKITFEPVTVEQAVALEKQQLQHLTDNVIEPAKELNKFDSINHSPIIATFKLDTENVVVRIAGDHFVLIEVGPLELDIELRFKVHALMLEFEKNYKSDVIDITPGIRSLQIHYNAQTLTLKKLLQYIKQSIDALGKNTRIKVPSRIVHLPLSWDDPACQKAIDKYMQSVRPDAPWCPSNLDFIKRINGLQSIEEVKNIVFNASYLVMGLGDVYLGAPVATPIDPRHRLVTTKYNPARTWTAENSVGIGGAYMCVYGMEGPGGYQFVGRTIQMWNRYKKTTSFSQPWLLRFFDQIKFYEVSNEELTKIRQKIPLGYDAVKIEDVEFDLNEYDAFKEKHKTSIDSFQKIRQKAFNDELTYWKENGHLTYEKEDVINNVDTAALPDNTETLDSPVSGNIWQCLVKEGDDIKKGDTLMVLESMKMEFPIQAIKDGKIAKILIQEGRTVTAGQPLLWVS